MTEQKPKPDDKIKKRVNEEKKILEMKMKEAIKYKDTKWIPAFTYNKTGQRFYLTTPEQLKNFGLNISQKKNDRKTKTRR